MKLAALRAKGLATWLALLWVRCYTRGLAQELRESRRAEIASDTWDQVHGDRYASGAWVLVRCLLGVPADLSWRLEHSATAHAPGRAALRLLAIAENGGRWIVRRGLPGLTVLFAGFYALLGFIVLVTIPLNENAPHADLAWFGGLCLLASAFIVIGSRRLPRHAKSGSAILIVGAIPMSLALMVTVVVPGVAAIVVGSEVVRGVRARRRQAAGNPVAGGGARRQ